MQQLSIEKNSLQPIFAFVILGLLAIATILVLVPPCFGYEVRFTDDDDEEGDIGERQPLLED